MPLARPLRNRIVGFLVIVSAILMILPVLLNDSQEKHREKLQENDNIIMFDHDAEKAEAEGPQLLHDDPAFADLQAPEDDLPQPDSAASSLYTGPNPDAAPKQADSAVTAPEFDNIPPQMTTVQPVQPARPQNQGTEILTAQPAPQRPQQSAQPPRSNGNTEILTAPAPQRVQTARTAPAVQPQPKPAAAPQSSQSATGSMPQGAFSVQVGVFSQRANAQKVVSKLQQAGIQAYLQNANVNGTQMVRVYAGSASSREALTSLQQKIDALTSLKSRIVPVK